MSKKTEPATESPRPRLKKETLRGLGFAELEEVRGGNPPTGVEHPKPIASRFCLQH
jgi:hypothetical protein